VFFGGALLLDIAVAQMIDFLKLNMFQRVRYKRSKYFELVILPVSF